MLKKTAATAAAGILAALIASPASAATTFAESNSHIEIIPNDHVGYQFVGGESNPDIVVDITKIAKVKYYIRCPDLEQLGPAEVQLVYNSGTTGWSQAEPHDLHDGLIIERDVPQLPEGDYFEALLGTWNEEIAGDVAFEVLDANGSVLGADYAGNIIGGGPETPTPPQTNPPASGAAPTSGVQTEPRPSGQVLGDGQTNTAPVNTGRQEIAAITVAAILSVGVIIAARRNKE